ncbi:EAL domain-containing protein [Vibrio campbellii]|uniref:EAL domain-containing protein n=1 Tax=Vibrio campbellii TaxID=680 RepID=UPI003F850CC5
MAKNKLIPILILTLSLATGCALLVGIAHSHLKQESAKLLKSGAVFLDKLFLNADVTAQRAYFFTKQPCKETLPFLRELVVISPDVQLISFIKNDRIYCSSLRGEVDIKIDHSVLDDSFFLQAHSPFNPKESSLEFISRFDNAIVVSSVSGYHIRQILQSVSEERTILLHIDDKVMDKQKVLDPLTAKTSIRLASSNYPYSLSIELTHQDYVEHILEHKLFLVMYFLLLCGALSGTSYFLMNKPDTLESLIASAIESEQIVPYLQPYVDKDSNIVGVEVLARWQHPTKGLINPDLFIPIAESSGLVIPMTSSLMKQVQKKLVCHKRGLPDNFSISFNISAKHCTQPELLSDSLCFLKAFPDAKVELCLELTERELVKDTQEARELFDTLHEHSVQLALDDFGTGHSNLNYLNVFHFDILKIDRNFVQMIGSNSVSMHIVDNLLDLALRLGMKTVAEGVETEEQREYLIAHGVDYLQGYFFYKPMKLDDFVKKFLG